MLIQVVGVHQLRHYQCLWDSRNTVVPIMTLLLHGDSAVRAAALYVNHRTVLICSSCKKDKNSEYCMITPNCNILSHFTITNGFQMGTQ